MGAMVVNFVLVWSRKITMIGSFVKSTTKLRYYESTFCSLTLCFCTSSFPTSRKVFYLQCIERCQHEEPCLGVCNREYYQNLKTCPCGDYCSNGCPCEGLYFLTKIETQFGISSGFDCNLIHASTTTSTQTHTATTTAEITTTSSTTTSTTTIDETTDPSFCNPLGPWPLGTFEYLKSEPLPHCENFWEDEMNDCMDFCSVVDTTCRDECKNDFTCINTCDQEYWCCRRYCPCKAECPSGCPCPHDLGFCPEPERNEECLDSWQPQAEVCEADCKKTAEWCLTKCLENDRECIQNCRIKAEKCTDGCPCHTKCERGCDEKDFCPSWDDYCQATTTKQTTSTELTTETTTPDYDYETTEMPIPDTDTLLAINYNTKAALIRSDRWLGTRTVEIDHFDFNQTFAYYSCSVTRQGKMLVFGGSFNPRSVAFFRRVLKTKSYFR